MDHNNKSYINCLKQQWTYSMQILGGILLLLYLCSLKSSSLRGFNFAKLPGWFVVIYIIGSVLGGAYYQKYYCVQDEGADDLL